MPETLITKRLLASIDSKGKITYIDPASSSSTARPHKAVADHSSLQHKASSLSPNPSESPTTSSLAILNRIKACNWFVARSDCGCGANQCLRGKGKGGIVSYHDCIPCLHNDTPKNSINFNF